jgi:hypothetical protein
MLWPSALGVRQPTLVIADATPTSAASVIGDAPVAAVLAGMWYRLQSKMTQHQKPIPLASCSMSGDPLTPNAEEEDVFQEPPGTGGGNESAFRRRRGGSWIGFITLNRARLAHFIVRFA